MSFCKWIIASSFITAILFNPHHINSLSSSSPTPPLIIDNAPSWSDLKSQTLSTPTGARLSHESQLRTIGEGPPHISAKLRLFDTKEKDDVEITLYRDSSGWCPYCQKVWIYLEEKCIPYKVKTVPLNAYGDKPVSFTRLVDGGKLPAIEINGEVVKDSLEIVKFLEEIFLEQGPRMFPEEKEEKERMETLLNLEQELQSKWFSLVFYPVQNEALVKARGEFISILKRVDSALAKTSSGPWFLDGSSPTFIDIQFITHMERIAASVLFWKGMNIRNDKEFPNIEKWMQAFESRPSYQATKSDVYTLIMSIPSQNGPGYFSDDGKKTSSKILGLNGAWNLPFNDKNEEEHRHEAAYALTQNHDAITSFATRGASEPGRPSFHAELADPYAEPNDDFISPVDICLRHVTSALLNGVEAVEPLASADLVEKGGDGTLQPSWGEYVNDDDNQVYWWNEETGEVRYQSAPTMQLDTCFEYLRDRVGVPRDMSEGAARQLRGHLNWIISLLR